MLKVLIIKSLTPYWSALDFWIIEWDRLDFGLFQTWILQVTQAVKIKFDVLDQKSNSSNLIFQKLSADQQGISGVFLWNRIWYLGWTVLKFLEYLLVVNLKISWTCCSLMATICYVGIYSSHAYALLLKNNKISFSRKDSS